MTREQGVSHRENRASQSSASGLDMGPTIQFYEEHSEDLMRAIPEHLDGPHMEIALSGMEHIHLTEEQIHNLIGHYPEPARERSVLKSITGKPSLWFRGEVPEGESPVTTDVSEALSPTAIVPSHVSYVRTESGGISEAHIELYEIPEDTASDQVRTLIHAQGLVHEVGHTIVAPSVFGDEDGPYSIRLTDGTEVDGFDMFCQFAQVAEKLPPVSRYSSEYRDRDNNFKSKEKLMTSISEEMVESMTAGLMQFSSTPDPARRFIPLVDRPQVVGILTDFLSGRKV